MKKSISAKQKTRGRPATGITPMMGFRAEPAIRARVVGWAEKQPDMPSLSEAIRRLVEIGLSKSNERPQVPATAKQSAARAAALAAKTIDKRIDPRAPPEEREVRKRKLVEGPSPFRDSRKDRP